MHAGLCSGLIRATLHMVNREFGELAADFISLGLLPPGADRDAIVPALTSAREGVQGQPRATASGAAVHANVVCWLVSGWAGMPGTC